MKGIIYCRVSSHEQTHGTSLDNQREACLEYAKRHEIEVVEIFVERGESATAADRPQFIEAIEYCRQHRIETFIVWKLDRFARNITDHFAVRARLLEFGTTLHSVTEPLDSSSPHGKFLEGIFANVAELENETRKQRCEGGLRRRISDGIRPWQPPIGYINSKKRIDRRKTVPDEPDPERFFIVQRGLREYGKGGLTIDGLVALYNQWGLQTRRGLPMRKQLAERMLRDKFYAGVLVDPWSGEEFPARHEPMITLEEFARIQAIKNGVLSQRGIAHLNANSDFPLRRFVQCLCGQKLTAGWRRGRSKKYAYYNCTNKQCLYYQRGIAKADLEAKFLTLLQAITPQARFLRLFKAIVIDHWESQRQQLSKVGENYEHELQRLQSQRENLVVMRMNGELNTEEFLDRKAALENRITGLQISENETKIDELDIEAVITYAVQFMGNVSRLWQDAVDVKTKQRLQRMVFPGELIYDKSAGNFCTAVLSPVFELSRTFTGKKSDLVAGPGFAPGTRGYEPRDVLLVHPAAELYINFTLDAIEATIRLLHDQKNQREIYRTLGDNRPVVRKL